MKKRFPLTGMTLGNKVVGKESGLGHALSGVDEPLFWSQTRQKREAVGDVKPKGGKPL